MLGYWFVLFGAYGHDLRWSRLCALLYSSLLPFSGVASRLFWLGAVRAGDLKGDWTGPLDLDMSRFSALVRFGAGSEAGSKWSDDLFFDTVEVLEVADR